MKKIFLVFAAVTFLFASCISFRTLHSTTYIKANDAFILGDNEHGKFQAYISNPSSTDITVWQCPIEGGQHSPLVIKASQNATIKVPGNTAIRIENPSAEQVAVNLKVKGDVGLSMGYKN